MNDRPAPRLIAGIMTGTSLDGMDAALLRIDGRGLACRATLVGRAHRGLGSLARELRAVAEQAPRTAGDLARLAWDFGELHAVVVGALLDDAGLDRPPDLVVAHGQTVVHRPPISWQLLDPAPLAHASGAPVLTDLRQADLAAGGQGAPITPLADWILFRAEHARAIVNLGGFCNLTHVPPEGHPEAPGAIRGRDVCTCNQLLDAIARAHFDAPFDRDGANAACGRVQPGAAQALERALGHTERSLGTGDEMTAWVSATRGTGADLAATAVDVITRRIAQSIGAHPADEVIIAGGGARHRTLVARLEAAITCPVRTSDAVGIPIDLREAAAMAVLGALALDGVATTLPQVTGCSTPAPVGGRWTAPFPGSS